MQGIAQVSQADIAYPVQSASEYTVVGKPTISASFINRVLKNTPAHDTGRALYEASVSKGLDPAYALAFFAHESGYGTQGTARFTHSLGNIICTQGWRCIGRFRYYSTFAASYYDWASLIRYEYVNRGLVTVQQITPVYAPSADHNSPVQYAQSVIRAVNAYRAGQFA